MLNDLRRARQEIEIQAARYQELEYLSTGIRSSKLDGMPGGSGYDNDHIGIMLEKLEALSERINTLQAEYKEKCRFAEALVDQVNNPAGRAVLQARYLDYLSWDTVDAILYPTSEDYNDRFDSYRRRTFRTHANALQQFEKLYGTADNQEKYNEIAKKYEQNTILL